MGTAVLDGEDATPSAYDQNLGLVEAHHSASCGEELVGRTTVHETSEVVVLTLDIRPQTTVADDACPGKQCETRQANLLSGGG